jgi:hypothetical protein
VLLGLVVIAAWLPQRRIRELIVPVGLTAAVALLTVSPWVVRNSRVVGEPTWISQNLGEALYSGHSPTADGGPTYAPSELLAPALILPAGAEQEVAISDITQRAALEWAREHPVEELELIPKRLAHLLQGDGDLVSTWIEGSPEAVLGSWRTPFEVLADVGWYLLLAAVVVTLAARRAHLHQPWVLPTVALPALSLVLYGVVLYGNFRYRMPYEPILALLVAGAWLHPVELEVTDC